MAGSGQPSLPKILGDAVAACWADLSQEAQQTIFESAATVGGGAEDELVREQLAVFLHNQHPRTERPTPMPDNISGETGRRLDDAAAEIPSRDRRQTAERKSN